jgi:hypothetical protein
MDPRVLTMSPMHCACADYMSVLVGIRRQGGVPLTMDPRVPNMAHTHCARADYMSPLVTRADYAPHADFV